MTVTQNANGTYKIVPTLDYTNTSIFKLTDPQGWGNNGTQPVVQSGFLNQPKFRDDLKSLRAALKGDIDGSIIKSWKSAATTAVVKRPAPTRPTSSARPAAAPTAPSPAAPR